MSVIVLAVSGHTATLNCSISELRNCVKMEVPSCVRYSPCRLCGHTATLNCSISELRNCEKVEVAVLSSPSLIGLIGSMITYIALFSALLSRLTALACGAT